ncbi:hypothetical protein D3C87_1126280 [compost metagenome]
MASSARSQRGRRSSSTSTSELVVSAKRPPSDSQLKVLSSANCNSATVALSSRAKASSPARMRSIGAVRRIASEANSPVPIQLHAVTMVSSISWACMSSGRSPTLFCQSSSAGK